MDFLPKAPFFRPLCQEVVVLRKLCRFPCSGGEGTKLKAQFPASRCLAPGRNNKMIPLLTG